VSGKLGVASVTLSYGKFDGDLAKANAAKVLGF
jgi:hypothetical protein